MTDYGEYFLGKTAGSADKTAILHSKRGKVVVLGSFPSRVICTVDFPKTISVFIAQSNIPRLTTSDGIAWLEAHRGRWSHFDPHITHLWALHTLRRCGSLSFMAASQALVEALRDPQSCQKMNISPAEADLVMCALASNLQPMLRELTASGALATYSKRQDLVLRLIKLLPFSEQLAVMSIESSRGTQAARYTMKNQSENLELDPKAMVSELRKTVLYGISEQERGVLYLNILRDLNHSKSSSIASLLELVRRSHDGDRALVDYRYGFSSTNWALSIYKEELTDDALERIRKSSKPLATLCGSFERSLPEFDALADRLESAFGERAAGRISAAGLGGSMTIHVASDAAEELIQWFKNESYKGHRIENWSRRAEDVEQSKSIHAYGFNSDEELMDDVCWSLLPVIHGPPVEIISDEL